MSGDILWQADESLKNNCQMGQFLNWCNDKHNLQLKQYHDLHKWSCDNPGRFWSDLFSYFEIPHEGSLEPAHKELSFTDYPWFPQVKLNFAKCLLKNFESDKEGLVGVHESGARWAYSHKEIFNRAANLEGYLKDYLSHGDVLAAYMPNIPETVFSMLATTSLGGVFTSTSADFGVKGVIDRFGQSLPKVLVTVSGYEYNGKYIDLTERLKEVVEHLPQLEKLIVVDFLGKAKGFDLSKISNKAIWYHDIKTDNQKMSFVPRNFSDPLYIMYSSGTTGKPKCIVHSIGGTILQHVKELGLHCDLDENKTIMYFTTCGWMMWNWLVSALFFGGKTIVYEGSPGKPSLGEFFNIINKEKINLFGTSPKFLKAMEEEEKEQRKFDQDFPTLETILSTGAPLLPEQFDFVYKNIKKDVLLGSISGGTDILGCFMLANPLLKVRRGKIQGPGLGMNLVCYDGEGKESHGSEGELICKTSFPSQPIYFLNDEDKTKLKAAYFDEYPGVWHHGDFITIDKDLSVTVHGRSDATLNPGGVRIGTAEIYRQTEQLNFLEDSLCVGKDVKGEVEVWLFVKMKEGENLSDDKIATIKSQIKNNTTPRHTPRQVYAIDGIPYTRSGKKMELAITRLLNNKPLTNIEAVANPECLKQYEKYKA